MGASPLYPLVEPTSAEHGQPLSLSISPPQAQLRLLAIVFCRRLLALLFLFCPIISFRVIVRCILVLVLVLPPIPQQPRSAGPVVVLLLLVPFFPFLPVLPFVTNICQPLSLGRGAVTILNT